MAEMTNEEGYQTGIRNAWNELHTPTEGYKSRARILVNIARKCYGKMNGQGKCLNDLNELETKLGMGVTK